MPIDAPTPLSPAAVHCSPAAEMLAVCPHHLTSTTMRMPSPRPPAAMVPPPKLLDGPSTPKDGASTHLSASVVSHGVAHDVDARADDAAAPAAAVAIRGGNDGALATASVAARRADSAKPFATPEWMFVEAVGGGGLAEAAAVTAAASTVPEGQAHQPSAEAIEREARGVDKVGRSVLDVGEGHHFIEPPAPDDGAAETGDGDTPVRPTLPHLTLVRTTAVVVMCIAAAVECLSPRARAAVATHAQLDLVKVMAGADRLALGLSDVPLCAPGVAADVGGGEAAADWLLNLEATWSAALEAAVAATGAVSDSSSRPPPARPPSTQELVALAPGIPRVVLVHAAAAALERDAATPTPPSTDGVPLPATDTDGASRAAAQAIAACAATDALIEAALARLTPRQRRLGGRLVTHVAVSAWAAAASAAAVADRSLRGWADGGSADDAAVGAALQRLEGAASAAGRRVTRIFQAGMRGGRGGGVAAAAVGGVGGGVGSVLCFGGWEGALLV